MDQIFGIPNFHCINLEVSDLRYKVLLLIGRTVQSSRCLIQNSSHISASSQTTAVSTLLHWAVNKFRQIAKFIFCCDITTCYVFILGGLPHRVKYIIIDRPIGNGLTKWYWGYSIDFKDCGYVVKIQALHQYGPNVAQQELKIHFQKICT